MLNSFPTNVSLQKLFFGEGLLTSIFFFYERVHDEEPSGDRELAGAFPGEGGLCEVFVKGRGIPEGYLSSFL